MVQVTELGYLGLGVSDLDAWIHMATDVVGLELVEGETAGTCYLRMDYWHHRIRLIADGSDDLAYLGLRVAGRSEFECMVARLEQAGLAVRVGSRDEAAERRVQAVMKLEDPSGVPVEIFHGPEVHRHRPFHPGRPMHGRFRTGAAGLGHCVLHQGDVEAAWRFYTLLGMRGGAEYPAEDGSFDDAPTFMHCNERDHTIAFGMGSRDKRVNHIMVEADNMDDVGLTYELVRENAIPVELQPGRHANDEMYSFYFRNPSGWMIEYGWGARPASHQSEYYPRDILDHAPEAGGF